MTDETEQGKASGNATGATEGDQKTAEASDAAPKKKRRTFPPVDRSDRPKTLPPGWPGLGAPMRAPEGPITPPPVDPNGDGEAAEPPPIITPTPRPLKPTAPGPAKVSRGDKPTPVERRPLPTPNVAARPVEGQPTVHLTIDGQSVEVAKGTNVLEAAKHVGKDICHFCYHSGLQVAASCRQCLVEIENSPKLVPACQAEVRDDMVVQTESPRVVEARAQMLEFTLVNHPIDCPICDKAGECTLQRHYMDHDHQLTRVDVPKVRKPKVKDIGEHIVLDAERCILCSRCIRFCDEVSETGELTMVNRGDREEVDVAAGARLDNPYSLNVVDICPVGALTSKDFRFQIRAWELHGTPTTCNGCATGCSIELQSKHEQAYRVVPREDHDVNGHWMCDEGRFIYRELDPALRVRQARVDGETVPLQEAIAAVAKGLEGKTTAVVFSGSASNEANLAAAALAMSIGATRYELGRRRGEGDDRLRHPDKNPNTHGAALAAGDNCKHEAELALELAGGALQAVIWVDGTGSLSDLSLTALSKITSVCLADRTSKIADACRIVLPAASWAEITGSYFNAEGRLRELNPAWRPEGDRLHRAELLRRILVELGHPDTVGTPAALTRKLAQEHGHARLLKTLDDAREVRPRLLRWANSRG